MILAMSSVASCTWICRFLPSAKPTSRETLAAAGLLAADSVLLAADESLRSNPAEADAQVLAALVEVQHLLASRKIQQQSYSAASSSSRSTVAVAGLAVAGSAGSGSSSSGLAAIGTAGAVGLGAVTGALGKSVKKVGSFGANSKKMVLQGDGFEPGTSGTDAVSAAGLAGKDVGSSDSHTADSAALQQQQLSLADRAASAARMQQQEALLAEQQEQRNTPPHVVACVATSSSKAVAAAFFGPPDGANDNAKVMTSSSTGNGADSAADAVSAESSSSGSEGGVVGGLFTYELLVPGEVEGSVLVQVANEPQYVKVGAACQL
jgi:hypothetical protein